jgi:hypothetical protein
MTKYLSKAIDDVANERERQIIEEDYTGEYDDGHDGGVLASAAGWGNKSHSTRGRSPCHLAWSGVIRKPKSAYANLVRAAVLILAGLDRMDRAKV